MNLNSSLFLYLITPTLGCLRNYVKYKQLRLTEEQYNTMNRLRQNEKDQQKVAIHKLPKLTSPVRLIFH